LTGWIGCHEALGVTDVCAKTEKLNYFCFAISDSFFISLNKCSWLKFEMNDRSICYAIKLDA
jgi:hypothetical protein